MGLVDLFKLILLHTTAIKQIAQSRPSDKDSFHNVPWDANTRVLANGLKSKMENFTFIVSLVVTKEILSYLSAATTALQGNFIV